MKLLPFIAATATAGLLAAVGTAAAGAAGIPDGCTGGGLNPSFAPDPGSVDLFHIRRVGDQMQIGVTMRNDAAGSCTVDDATVSVEVPNPDGTLGPSTTIVTGATFPGGMPPTQLTTKVPYTVAFNAGVFRGPVRIFYTGTGHYPGGDAPSNGSLQSNLVVSKPHATLTVAPSTPSGPAPLAVTYTYTLKNDSPSDPAGEINNPTPAFRPDGSSSTPSGSALTDDLCGPIAYTTGDTHVTDPAQIDPGETWTFTCMHVFGAFGTFTNHVAAAGGSTRDGLAWPETTALSAVTANAPDVTIAKSHTGDFTRGDAGRTFTIAVSNTGDQPTTGSVSATDALPAGLAATGISGTGWACTLATLTCTRADVLAAGSAYPPITVTVNVATDAPASLVNSATVSGGGDAGTTGNTANDPVTILAPLTPAGSGTPQGGGATTLPSNAFTLRRIRISKATGTAVLTLGVPGAGRFAAAATAGGTTVARGAASARTSGTVSLTLRPTAKAKGTLRRKGKLKTKLAVTFTPTGGTASTQRRALTLRLTRPR